MNNQFATQYLREEFLPEQRKTVKEDGGMAAAPAGGSTTGGGVTNGATFTPGTGEQYAAGTRKKKYQEDKNLTKGAKIKWTGKDKKVGNSIVKAGDRGEIKGQEAGDEYVVDFGQHTFYASLATDFKPDTIEEDAPRLAGSPAKTDKQGAKNLSAYSSVGFTKAPTAQEAGKKMKSIEVKDLWNEEPLSESRAYNQFRRDTATRNKPDQLHEAAKAIQKKLDEVGRLLEFTAQMRTELSEGDINLEYKHNTKKVFEKINSKVIEVYTKVKSLK